MIAIRKRGQTTPIGNLVESVKYVCPKHLSQPNDKIPTCSDSTSDILYLMVQRKDTMGYVDFIRGKYDEYDEQKKWTTIKTYLEEMTCDERIRLVSNEFETLWSLVWMNHSSKLYINEFHEAERKFKNLDIHELLQKSECKWSEQEYGFPKGRKNMYETNIKCAEREFREESGYASHHYKILSEKPFEEIFTGTNGIRYRHVYFICEIPESSGLPKIDITNIQQVGEISNCGWFTFEQCMQMIRPYDEEKKNVLRRVHEKYGSQVRAK
jgi:8-oxo-dGTP pyrophosphatase MutT (NUDIX family)